MIKGQHVRNAVGTAKAGGHVGGRVATGVTMIAVGGLGALLWGTLTGAVEMTQEVFHQPALGDGSDVIDAAYRVEP